MALAQNPSVRLSGKVLAGEGNRERLTTGRLRNGVRFAILSRHDDEPGAALLMRDESGFIIERRPGERGLVHLIEHIAFLSPTIRAPDDLHHVQHVGLPLTLPAPSAGTTDWRETNYFLSTRTTRTADLNALLALFREITSELTLRPDSVDEARAQVVAEMAAKKPGNEAYASYIAAVAPGSPTDVIDAQNSDDVPTATVSAIRSLYRRAYRPENTMLVVVGNVDVAAMKASIEAHFGSWTPLDAASAPTTVPKFQGGRIAPISFSSTQQGRRIITMTVVMPNPAPAISRTGQADATLIDMVATRAVDNRMIRSQPDLPPGSIGMHIEHGEQGHRLIMLWHEFAADGWRPALTDLRRTTCDLDSLGFTQAEWRVARQGVLHDLEQQANNIALVPNVEIAKDLSHDLAAGRKYISRDELLRRARIALPRLDAQSGSAWWHRQWHAGVEHLRVEAPELTRSEDPLGAIKETADRVGDPPVCRIRQ